MVKQQLTKKMYDKEEAAEEAAEDVMAEEPELQWDYMSLNHYINHLHFFRRQPLLFFRTIWGVFRTKVLRQHTIRSVELAVTYNCNLRCDKCFALKFLEGKKEKFLSVEEIKNLWDQAYKMGAIHVNVTGGEPTARKDICEVIRALKPKGTLISLVTNSTLITEDKIKALREAGLNTLQISLDSSKPELHDKYRGYKGAYEKAMNACRLAKKHGLNVCFTTVATHENINTDEIPKMLKLAKEMGVLLLINFAGRSGGWRCKDHLVLTKDDRKELNQYMKNPNARLCQMFNYYLKPQICLMGKDKLNIGAYGDVYPCTHVFLKFGNIREEPLADIWERMGKFEAFKGFTHDCPRCDNKEFICKYLDPIAEDPSLQLLDVRKDFPDGR